MSTALLCIVACGALAVGPLCAQLGAGSERLTAAVDGLSLTLVSGICLGLIFPHLLDELGLLALLFTGVGAVLPIALHAMNGRTRLTPGLAAAGMLFHALLDGCVIATGDKSSAMAAAVISHRLPMGFVLVVVSGGLFRHRAAPWWTLVILSVGTGAGVLFGDAIFGTLPVPLLSAVEAFVVGLLLHVVIAPHHLLPSRPAATSTCTHDHHTHDVHDDDGAHGHHTHDHHAHDVHNHRAHDVHDHHAAHADHAHDHGGHAQSRLGPKTLSALGAVGGGLLVLGFGAWTGGFSAKAVAFAETFLHLVVESAPALLLGYALAGIVPVLFSAQRLRSLTKGSSFRQALSGITFGLPLPICSCGVLPLYESLIRRGVPSAAAIAFFVATPELGVDALLLSMPLLGLPLTIARLVAAFAVALIVALVLSRFQSAVGRSEGVTQSFRAARNESVQGDKPWLDRVNEGLRFGFVEVFDHTMPWIVFGLVVAAVAEPLLSHDAIAQVPAWLQVPVAALVGVPLYVCASGATPIAAIAIHKGLSSGAVLAFLIAGPATNVTTFGVLTRLHGRRFAFGFGLCVTVLAIAMGLMADAVGVQSSGVLATHASAAHANVWNFGCAVTLLAIGAASLLRQGPRGVLHQLLQPIHSH